MRQMQPDCSLKAEEELTGRGDSDKPPVSTFRLEELIGQVVDQIDALLFRNCGVHFSLRMLEEILHVEFGAIEDLTHLALLKGISHSVETFGIDSEYYIQAAQAAGFM